MSNPEQFPLSVFPPEHMGVSPRSILRFLDRLEERRLCMHSFVLTMPTEKWRGRPALRSCRPG